MAGSKFTPPLRLTREQLAEFLPDHQMIRAFENLFATVEPLSPSTIDDLTIMAGQADNKAIQALQSLAQIAQDAAVNAGAADDKAIQALQAIAQLAQDAAICCAVSENQGRQALETLPGIEQAAAVNQAVIEARTTQALDVIATLSQAVELLALAPPPREFKRSRYGSFYDTTTQAALVVNTATAITFNTTDLSRGVYLGTPTSRVYVDTDGIYNFQTSIQLDSSVATAENFYLWFRLNGADVTNSASQLRVQGNNAEVFVALNYFFSLKAGDYVELMYSVSNLGVVLLASGAVAPHPGIPSIILTVANNIGGIDS
jgi:hypothetical protein